MALHITTLVPLGSPKAKSPYTVHGETPIWNSLSLVPEKAKISMLVNRTIHSALSHQDRNALLQLMKSCGKQKNLRTAKELHSRVKELIPDDLSLSNGLLSMLAKCGAFEEAREVFEKLPKHDVVSWSTLIAANAQHGYGDVALKLFHQMQDAGISPDAVTYTCVLKACGNTGSADMGQKIHLEVKKQGLLQKDIILCNSLIDMYAKCGMLERAQEVFEEFAAHNQVSWNALIAGYVQQGNGDAALKCLRLMQNEGICPDAVTFTCILKVCGSTGSLKVGKGIHAGLKKQGLLEKDVMLGTALLDMYAKCGELGKAQQIFEELPKRNVVTWSALISGYAQYGFGDVALKYFRQMKNEGISPNLVTFISILKACGSIGSVVVGEEILAELRGKGFLEKDIKLGTALVDMYVKCAMLEKAYNVLRELPKRDVVSWSALIAGYAQHGCDNEVIKCFQQMLDERIAPNAVTFTCVLKSCGSLGYLELGKEIHEDIRKQSLLQRNLVLGTSLVDMYAKCGYLQKADEVFQELPEKDTVSWSSLIGGYTENGHGEIALKYFRQMKDEGFTPDTVTYISILKACGAMGSLQIGGEIHEEIKDQGLLEKDIMLGNTLVDMYAKCGALSKAHEAFGDLAEWGVVSWNALIAAHAQMGEAESVLRGFEKMELDGIRPDSISFLILLNACNHAGFLKEGELCFTNMWESYSITPQMEHYTCMVDLFGRAGDFDNVKAVFDKLPSTDHLPLFAVLLFACCKWSNVELSRWAFEKLMQIDASSAAAYISMSNISMQD